jgi:hypothetical protein
MEATQITNPPTFESVWVDLQEEKRLMKELRESQKETDRIVKENARQIGDLGNRFGELAEHLVAPSIREKFNELGFRFTQAGPDVKFADPDTLKYTTEVDVFLENGDIAIAVEVKAKPKIKDVDYQIWRMGVLRRHADRKNDKRQYQGAIAGAIMGEDVRRYILENGFYVIEQTGDTVQITIPDGFKARDW